MLNALSQELFAVDTLAGHRCGADPGRRDNVTYYQYRHDRARRTLRGFDEQVGEAEKAVAGKTAVKRNRFVQLAGGTKSVNRDLEAKARALAGFKAYTNMVEPDPETVIGAYNSSRAPRPRSGCPSTTCKPGRSTTASANP